MTEEKAKAISDNQVYSQIAERSMSSTPYLQQVFKEIKSNPNTIIYHQPVSKGNVPNKWYSDRMF